VIALYRSLRSLKLYPVENQQVHRALDEMSGAVLALLEHEQELEVTVSGELIFVNQIRLRLDLDNYASFGHVLTTFTQCGIGVLRVNPAVDRREWQVFISELLRFAARGDGANSVLQLRQRLDQAGVEHIVVEPPTESEGEQPDEERQKQRAKRTYERSLAVIKGLIGSTRMGRLGNVRKVKRAVQNIIDQVLSNEVTLVGMTNLRDYDDYTFTHSLNVCIFSLAIAKRLGFTRRQLFELGMAALCHDIGKGRIPLETLKKPGKLTPEEWRAMQSHTYRGALSLFKLRDYGRIPYRSMIAAYEHHMKTDLTGYPKSVRPRRMSLSSRIVAIADAFDAATSTRVYEKRITPDEVLRKLWEDPETGFDPVLVKALMNLLGIYPVGTCVILDSRDLAIVHAANSDLTLIHRPVVRVICTANGTWLRPGPLLDLSETTEDGHFGGSIVKVTTPEKYGIRAADYFV
jgi:HD-GYP domain-containing protein (c-di-GMP phosphodiesterase class II)